RRGYWDAANRRVSRRGVLRGGAVGTAGVAGFALVGCGDDDDDDGGSATPGGDSTPGGQTPAASPTQGVSQPKSGGVYRERSIAGISAYEPYSNLSYSAQQHWGYMTN